MVLFNHGTSFSLSLLISLSACSLCCAGTHRLFFPSAVAARCNRVDASSLEYIGINVTSIMDITSTTTTNINPTVSISISAHNLFCLCVSSFAVVLMLFKRHMAVCDLALHCAKR